MARNEFSPNRYQYFATYIPIIIIVSQIFMNALLYFCIFGLSCGLLGLHGLILYISNGMREPALENFDFDLI